MLQFLGSGSAFNVERGNTSAYFEWSGELFLFDVGEDVFHKLVKYNLLENKTRINIFITHLHSDHVGSLGSLIAYLYYKIYNQDMGNICVYFPSDAIAEYLSMQGVQRDWYTLFVNKWDELFIPGYRKQPEYVFHETTHTEALNYKGAVNCYSIEFSIPKEVSFFYSGDTKVFHDKLSNIHSFDYVYQEVTSKKGIPVHLAYEELLEATQGLTKEERSKIYLMHLDEDFDTEKAVADGFNVVQNVEK